MEMTLEEKAKHYVELGNIESESFEWLKEKSFYCHNYYLGDLGDLIYAESDDDNTTEYFFVINGNKYGKLFAYSLASRGDELVLYFEERWLNANTL